MNIYLETKDWKGKCDASLSDFFSLHFSIFFINLCMELFSFIIRKTINTILKKKYMQKLIHSLLSHALSK